RRQGCAKQPNHCHHGRLDVAVLGRRPILRPACCSLDCRASGWLAPDLAGNRTVFFPGDSDGLAAFPALGRKAENRGGLMALKIACPEPRQPTAFDLTANMK